MTEIKTTSGLRAVSEGDTAPETTLGPITRTDLVRYAGAGGDFNPIHHDETFARQSGLESVFAMGMYHAGVLANHAAHWLGRENVRRLDLRFTGQVWPDDVLTIGGTVDSIEESDDGRLATCSLAATRQTGDVALKAKVVAQVA